MEEVCHRKPHAFKGRTLCWPLPLLISASCLLCELLCSAMMDLPWAGRHFHPLSSHPHSHSDLALLCSGRKNLLQSTGRGSEESRFIFSTPSARKLSAPCREAGALPSVSGLVRWVPSFLHSLHSPGVVTHNPTCYRETGNMYGGVSTCRVEKFTRERTSVSFMGSSGEGLKAG